MEIPKWLLESYPRHKAEKMQRASNPNSWIKRLWRRAHRAKQQHQMHTQPLEDIQDFPKNKITSIYDWY